jgi:ribose/xylose/arabinose/galactoside ABC-type transport system permease subunit
MQAAKPLPLLRRLELQYADAIPLAIIFVLDAALFVWMAHLTHGFTATLLGTILRQSIFIGLAALGQTLVILLGGIDMSVGSNAKVSALAAALFMAGHPGTAALGIPLGIAIGALIGAVNGFLIVTLRATPFIVTLGMFAILRGVAYTMSTAAIDGLPNWYFQIYNATLGSMPVAIFGLLVIVALVWILLYRTQFGRNLYAVGGEPEAARLAGIPIGMVTFAAYVACGIFAALAGLFATAQAEVGSPQIGDNLEFISITAVALGGISLFGGRGRMLGTIGGALLLTLVTGILGISGISEYDQQLVQGLIIILAVAVYKARE